VVRPRSLAPSSLDFTQTVARTAPSGSSARVGLRLPGTGTDATSGALESFDPSDGVGARGNAAHRASCWATSGGFGKGLQRPVGLLTTSGWRADRFPVVVVQESPSPCPREPIGLAWPGSSEPGRTLMVERWRDPMSPPRGGLWRAVVGFGRRLRAGTTAVMLQKQGSPREHRAWKAGNGRPRQRTLARSKALKSNEPWLAPGTQLETAGGQRLAVMQVRLCGWGKLWRVEHRRGSA